MISVVVPTLNAENTLAACLTSIRDQETPVDQIIVVDGGSTDQTLSIAQHKADLVLQTQANRSLQRNVGWQATDSRFILFIDADMILDSRVVGACEEAFIGDPRLVGLVIPEQSFGATFWARVKAFERTVYQGVWWMEAARCFRRADLIASGGYDPALVGEEDWDLDERMRQQGTIGRINPIIRHNEQRLTLSRIREKKGHYASTLRVYATRHPERARRQLSLLQRAGLFVRRPWFLLAHPILSGGLVILGGTEWWVKIRRPSTDSMSMESPMS